MPRNTAVVTRFIGGAQKTHEYGCDSVKELCDWAQAMTRAGWTMTFENCELLTGTRGAGEFVLVTLHANR